MNDVTQQCVSLASGTLSPDLRVDYQFGLVLGVNEFRQEQEYFLEKDYLYNRELHGYGTVSGLKVTATPLPDNDVLITIEAGMALDQWGRPVVIRNPQCARLGAWLAKREQQNPGEIASHRGASDDFHLYVVVSYDECEDALVPIPGQPCSSGDALQAPSRIRDSFNIGLRWEPPSMPAWDAVRCFAKLMAQVRIVPELALNLSDEDTIIEHVRQLNQPCPDDFFSSSPTGSPPDQFFQLPAVTARDALDRIFTVWVTEVRPKPELLPNLIDPGTSEAGILLARIDFTYAPDTKAITLLGPSPDNTDDDGRPFLLHTQLIQELLLLGSGGDVQVIHQGEAAKLEREFATLQVRDGHTLRAWVHHPDIVVIPPGTSADWSQILELKSEGVVLSIQDVSQGSDPTNMNVFEITINSFDNDRPQLIVPGARVELTFKVVGFQVQSDGSLQDSIDALDFDYVGHDRTANTITVYTIADHLPVREFVTFNTVMNDGIAQLTLWFHDQQVNLTASPGAVQVLRGVGNQPISFNLNSAGAFSFLWDLSAVQTSFEDKDFLSFSFDTNGILIGTDANSKTLTSFIRDQQVSLVGYDGDHTIQAFYEVDIPPPGDDILSQPAQPFVTITPVTHQFIFELWFHLNLVPQQNTVVIREPVFRVFAELDQDATGLVKASIQNSPQRNVFNITLDPASWKVFNNSPYLRFVFPLQENVVSTPQAIPLRDYIRNARIKFDGFNGKDSIIVYVRVPQAVG